MTPGLDTGQGSVTTTGSPPWATGASPTNGASQGPNGGAGNGWSAPPTPPAAPVMPPALPPGSEATGSTTTGQFAQVGTGQAAGAASDRLPAVPGGPVDIPPTGASGAVPAVAPIPRAFPLIPEPEVDGDGGGAGGRNYVIGGNVLGVVLAIITVVALVWALVIALRTDNTPEALAARSSSNRSGSNGGDNSAAMNTNTSGGESTTGTATGDTAAAGAAAAGDTGAAAGDTGGGGGAGGGSGGGATVGAVKFAPPTGTYTVTGSGSHNATPPNLTVPVSNPSLEVTAAGSGCYFFKFTMDPGNWSGPTLCGTSDGGVVMPKSAQYLMLKIGITMENTQTLNCSPPDIFLPGNAAPGVSGPGGGGCIGSNTSPMTPGKNKQTSTFTVVGKETVSGVQAWHVHREITMVPADSQNTQNGKVIEDWWISISDGLIVRFKQDVRATTTIVGVLDTTFTQQTDLTVTNPK